VVFNAVSAEKYSDCPFALSKQDISTSFYTAISFDISVITAIIQEQLMSGESINNLILNILLRQHLYNKDYELII